MRILKLTGYIFLLTGFLMAIGSAAGSEFTTSMLPSSFLPNILPLEQEMPEDSTELIYPIQDDPSGGLSGQQQHNPFDDYVPSGVERKVDYDPATGTYYVTTMVNGTPVGAPQAYSFDEYQALDTSTSIQDYWNEKAGNQSGSGSGVGNSFNLPIGKKLGPFGNQPVDIRPSGDITLFAGFRRNKVSNPVLPPFQQHPPPQFDFDMNININVIGKIGDRLKFTTNYNTLSTFDLDRELKLEYTGDEDEIIQKVEAGNVSFPLPTTLIPGAQRLWGIKADLKFGRLRLSTVVSQQKSKANNIRVENGAQTQEFEVNADKYEENRHFFLAQYFKDNFEPALETMPYINSKIEITNLEVWVTNSRGETEEIRDVVAFADLGEPDPHAVTLTGYGGEFPNNSANDLYSKLVNNPLAPVPTELVVSTAENQIGLKDIQDFKKTQARKLKPSEYTFDPKLGFISLNFALKTTEVLGVAYEYTTIFSSETYRVGELAQNRAPVNGQEPVLYLKMLKSTAQRPKLPIWDLMMKNIYNLGAYQISDEDFRLDVYYQNPGGGDIRFMPEGESVKGIPLIRLLNLDRLNVQNDPQPDGIFDFIEGLTIHLRNGRLMFPVLEPFGEDLKSQYAETEAALAEKYAYDELYDSTRVVAEQFMEKNRFYIKGTYKGTTSSVISLGAFNLPPGSVKVTAGGRDLLEGTDYTVDYNLGRVTIINEAYINSAVPVNVGFEDPSLFGLQFKTMVGARADYLVNSNFNLGATYMHLSQRPYTYKTNYGDDPISNRMLGVDGNYFRESRFLTKMVDKIPGLETKEPSSISAGFEAATFIPGHARAIDFDGGTVFVDDFEGAENDIFLYTPPNVWSLASTPRGDRFPESALTNDLRYNYNRARMSWYTIQQLNNSNVSSAALGSNHYTRLVYEREIFPLRQSGSNTGITNPLLQVFDLAYFPEDRGPYNYETAGSALSAGTNTTTGKLNNPESRWAGIQRALDYNDFEQANIEFIEFWMLDPFIDDPGNSGDLFINLGTVSEDILKDGRKFYENGLPTPGQPSVNLVETEWGKVPISPQITQGFGADTTARALQDVGFDGLNDAGELDKFEDYVNWVASNVANQDFTSRIFSDPSSDNYLHYSSFNEETEDPLEKFKSYGNPQGNAEINNSTAISTAFGTRPDSEDLNFDNNLEESEAYFEYKIPLSLGQLDPEVNSYIKEVVRVDADDMPGVEQDATWYQFRIPIREFTGRQGDINDFRSMQFIRLYMTGFANPVVLRFAKLNLVRNQWRRYLYSIREEGEYLPTDNGENIFFNVSAVSLEENGSRYVLPPGVNQERAFGGYNNFLQNEQSLALEVCDLPDGESKAVYKRINMDLRHFGKLKMFAHAEVLQDDPVGYEDGDITAFIRLGDDFIGNYYEYEIPLKKSDVDAGVTAEAVWPIENNFEVDLEQLVELKMERNRKVSLISNLTFDDPYIKTIYADEEETQAIGRISIVGSPTLGRVKQAMLGIRNPKQTSLTQDTDDGLPKCAEVWFNELRLTDFDESGGHAALARVDVKLADFGSINVAGNMHTTGFGTLEQRVTERFNDNFYEWGATGAFEMGNFFGQESGVKLPLLAGYTNSVSTPEYDPYDTDVPMERLLDSLRAYYPDQAKDTVRKARKIRQTRLSNKSINVTNAQLLGKDPSKKRKIYSPQNLNATYAYNQKEYSDHLIESEKLTSHLGVLGYNFSTRAKYITPFKKMIKSKSKYLRIIKDINFNLIPSNVNWATKLETQDGELQLRQLLNDPYPIQPSYFKNYTWDLNYGFKHDLTKSIKLDFNSAYSSRIDTFASKYSWDLHNDYNSRPVQYDQTANISYNVPINKIPIFDWTTLRLRYGAGYRWTAGSVYMADSLGHLIGNDQTIQVNADFNLNNLYNKSKFLKRVGGKGGASPSRPKKGDPAADLDKAVKKSKTGISPVAKALIRPLISVKRISLSFRETNRTDIPGFMFAPTPLLGTNWWNNSAPTGELMPFVFGKQPEKDWFYDIINDPDPERRWISNNILLNDKVRQSQQFNVTAKADLEPAKDLKINLDVSATYTTEESFYFKTDSANMYNILAPFYGGSYSVSYIPIRTAFSGNSMLEVPNLDGGIDTINIPAPLLQFKEEFRERISGFLGDQNASSQGQYMSPSDTTVNALIESGEWDYREGYGPYAQDVILPAFLAAYSGFTPDEDYAKNFSNYPIYKWVTPLPNWQITYTGLSKLPAFKKFFRSVKLSHGYNSRMSIANFDSNPQFDFAANPSPEIQENGHFPDEFYGYYPGTLNGDLNFFSFYRIPNITISENFAPLIGVDLSFENGLTTGFEFKKNRSVSLSLTNYQVIETSGKEYEIDLGYKHTGGMNLPLKYRGEKIHLPNDINFRFAFSYRDDQTTNYYIARNEFQATGGMTTIRINPEIDYEVNEQIRVSLFYEQTRNIPKITTSYPTSNSRGGLRVTFTLAP